MIGSIVQDEVYNKGKPVNLGGHLVIFENRFHCHNLEDRNAVTDLELVKKRNAIKYSKIHTKIDLT